MKNRISMDMSAILKFIDRFKLLFLYYLLKLKFIKIIRLIKRAWNNDFKIFNNLILKLKVFLSIKEIKENYS
ncbi:unnamed protein product [Blepharisma stoltei]|uniref:Uncharacterized protein n=1 Tax=Blepharisma stoltei TaxID=1481888 RepID=A0AAU9KAS9_9CILI|nr:unnamed protein product [Blepharisma stoltei]